MSGATMRREYLSMSEVADRYGLSLSSVRRRVADGTIPSSKLKRRVLIAVADADAAVRLARGLTSGLDTFGRAIEHDHAGRRAMDRRSLAFLDELDAAIVPPVVPGDGPDLDEILANLAGNRGEAEPVAPR